MAFLCHYWFNKTARYRKCDWNCVIHPDLCCIIFWITSRCCRTGWFWLPHSHGWSTSELTKWLWLAPMHQYTGRLGCFGTVWAKWSLHACNCKK